MIRMKLLAAALALAGTVGTAQAQKLEYDCDTPADHFSQLKLAGDAYSRGVTGQITAHDLYKSSKYSGAAIISLTGGRGWAVQIRLSGLAQTGPTMMTAELMVLNDGKIVEEKKLGGMSGFVDASTPVGFALTIGPDGTGAATLGRQTFNFTPSAGPTTAKVSCSTGDFLFSELELSR